MKVLILAAGYATRLHPLTLHTSKSLLPVGKKAMIDRILDKVAEAGGADSTYVITNAKFFDKFDAWRAGSEYRQNITLVNDGTFSNETRHGAIKDLYIAVEQCGIKDDLLVLAGDNLFDFSLDDFLSFARARKDGVSVALYDIKDPKAATKKFGVVKVGDRSVVLDFEEKPEEPKSSLVSTGIYYIPAALIPSIGEYIGAQEKRSDAPGYYIGWMAKKYKVYGFAFLEEWYDIGDIESYKKAGQRYSQKEK